MSQHAGQYPSDAEIEHAVAEVINPDAWPPHYVGIIRWACDWSAARAPHPPLPAAQPTEEFSGQALTHLIVEAKPRYWEDTSVNGVEDAAGNLIPFSDGVFWRPVIRLEDGQIEDWVGGTQAVIHYKVCDQGFYYLGAGKTRRDYKHKSNYVPDMLSVGEDGHGDYIIMTVDETGKIKDWETPTIDLGEWEHIGVPTREGE